MQGDRNCRLGEARISTCAPAKYDNGRGLYVLLAVRLRAPVRSSQRLANLGLGGDGGSLCKLCRQLMGIHGVLLRLLAKLVGGKMISFAVSRSGGVVGVGRKIV